VTGSRAEVIAHRGASAYASEHTLAAYDLAVEQGADAIEVDVRPTADGTLVLVHDATLLRTIGDPRPVGQLDRVALTQIAPPRRPLALDAILDRYAGRTRVVIDLKDPTPAWELEVASMVLHHGMREHAMVQSFDLAALRRLAAAVPWLRLMPLLPRRAASVADLDTIASYAVGIGCWHGAVDRDLIDAAHARGLSVRAWTVDQPADMRRLLALGVDGLITNAPDVAVTVAHGAPPLRDAA
jgi:glycerophosphoryl diester phosphodiesterase